MADKPKTTTVYAPVGEFSGTVVGVEFTDGKGETSDPGALAYFARKGYGIGEPVEDDEPDDDPEPAPATATVGTPLRDATVDAAPEGDDGEPFDPAEHTVDDVQAYLADADADERQRVLDAEQAGKARKSILDA